MLVPFVKLFEKTGIALRKFPVDLQTDMGPPPNPFTIVQIGMGGLTVTGIGLVITAARAERPGPTLAAIRLIRYVVLLQKINLRLPVHSLMDGAQFV